jgi:hypothetical protein
LWVHSASVFRCIQGLTGRLVRLLGFLLPTGPADQSQTWSSLAAADRKALKGQYAAAGIKVMVSAFGGTSVPTTDGVDPAQSAQTMANFVKANDLDGIDIDYEVHLCCQENFAS